MQTLVIAPWLSADEGSFDAAGTAVARGICQVGDETVMFGWGSQYTHGTRVRLALLLVNMQILAHGHSR